MCRTEDPSASWVAQWPTNERRESWCARLGSNQQPLPSEGSTLSIELRARMTEGTAFHIQNNGGRAAASPKQYLFSADPSTARTRPTDSQTSGHLRPRHRNPG